MDFGEVERDPCRHRQGDVLRAVLFVVTVHVDMQPLVGHVVSVLARRIVIVSNDRDPLALESVLQLHDEPCDVAALVAVSNPAPNMKP